MIFVTAAPGLQMGLSVSHEMLRLIAELERLTGANRNTLKVRLRELTRSELIERHGQGRATWYPLKAEGPLIAAS